MPDEALATRLLPGVFVSQKKKRLAGAAHKEAVGGKCFSGKAIRDEEVEACARTFVKEKSKILEEG